MAASDGNNISLYKNINTIKGGKEISIDLFFEDIRNGTWQDDVLRVRLIKDKKERQERKKNLPYVTLSGTFKERTDAGLEVHSGYIGIDFDNLANPEAFKEEMRRERYCVAAFISVSGTGVCAVFRIDPKKHREAFAGLSEYLFEKYKEPVDPTSVNISRPRYISYDPFIYVNHNKVERFTEYPKQKEPKVVPKVLFVESDFKHILEQITDNSINICENYHDWLRIGFALASKFSEEGRSYFHIISQYSSKYDPKSCDKQYTACLKDTGSRKTGIATLYYIAKDHGLEIYSDETRKIAYSSHYGKKSGLSPEQVVENLEKFEGIVTSVDVVRQAMKDGIELGEDTLIEQFELWVRQNYSLRRNEITRYIENNGDCLKQQDLNSIYIKAKKIFDKITYELVDRLINSDFIPTYNPFKEFFAKAITLKQGAPLRINLKEGAHLPIPEVVQLIRQHFPLVTSLFESIKTKDADYALYFGAKWMTGIVSAMGGEHSPLMLVLSGEEQNTGKTEWFRRLLPKEFHDPARSYPDYYAESKLDLGKDDEILMTQKILIMDDEMGGKSKKEAKRLKELTSKQTFSLREPYGRNNVDLLRIAVLCGTTNESDILADPTGNRRIIPVHVYSIDQQLYNSIDKVELFAEVYELFRCGLRWRFTKEDVKYLGQDSISFEVTDLESELIQKYFEPCEDGERMTCGEIKVYLENKTNQRLALDKISKQLKRLGFKQIHVRTSYSTKRCYIVTQLAELPKDLPF